MWFSSRCTAVCFNVINFRITRLGRIGQLAVLQERMEGLLWTVN